MACIKLVLPDSLKHVPATHSLGANPSFHFSNNHFLSLQFLHVHLIISSYTLFKGLALYVLNPTLYGLCFQPITLPFYLIHSSHSPTFPSSLSTSLCPPFFPIHHFQITSSLQPALSPLSLGTPGLPSPLVYLSQGPSNSSSPPEPIKAPVPIFCLVLLLPFFHSIQQDF